MELWKPIIEVIVIAILFLLSANITSSRLASHSIDKKLTQIEIVRENNLSGISLMTTLIYLGLLAYLLANYPA
jgi:flagellar basal body P-ring protein FlgI